MREEKAERYFKSGYNCAQAVFAAFADEFQFSEETALRVSCALGGGLGRMREVCGAVSGAALALGMRYGSDKDVVYPKVQEFCSKFKSEAGSIICRELLGSVDVTPGAKSEKRTESYYRKRPCVELVKTAVRILEGI